MSADALGTSSSSSSSSSARPGSPKKQPVAALGPSSAIGKRDPPIKHKEVIPDADKLVSLEPSLESGKIGDLKKMTLRWQMPQYDTEVARGNSTAKQVDGWRDLGEARSAKQTMISQILSRWWYVFPQWPAPETPWKQMLADVECTPNGEMYEIVPIKDYTAAPLANESTGMKKCYMREQYPGVFCTSSYERDDAAHLAKFAHLIQDDQLIMDLRPVNTCPSFAVLARKDMGTLVSYYFKALENQILIVKELIEKDGREEHKRKLMQLEGEQAKGKSFWTAAMIHEQDKKEEDSEKTLLRRPLFKGEVQRTAVRREEADGTMVDKIFEVDHVAE